MIPFDKCNYTHELIGLACDIMSESQRTRFREEVEKTRNNTCEYNWRGILAVIDDHSFEQQMNDILTSGKSSGEILESLTRYRQLKSYDQQEH